MSVEVLIFTLANTGTRCIHKIELSGNRLFSARQIFSVRLGFVGGIIIENNSPDSFSVLPDSAPSGASYLDYRYSYLTCLPGITEHKTLIAQPHLYEDSQFPTALNDCLLGDQNGEVRNASVITARSFFADARKVFQGVGETRYFAGLQGSTALKGYTSGGNLHWSITGQNDGGSIEFRPYTSTAANRHINIYNCRMIADTSATLNLTGQLTILRVSNTSIKIAMCGTDGLTRYSAPITLS